MTEPAGLPRISARACHLACGSAGLLAFAVIAYTLFFGEKDHNLHTLHTNNAWWTIWVVLLAYSGLKGVDIFRR